MTKRIMTGNYSHIIMVFLRVLRAGGGEVIMFEQFKTGLK